MQFDSLNGDCERQYPCVLLVKGVNQNTCHVTFVHKEQASNNTLDTPKVSSVFNTRAKFIVFPKTYTVTNMQKKCTDLTLPLHSGDAFTEMIGLLNVKEVFN